MKWITREHPKIDRLACPWLIKNFIDTKAEFFYVAFEDVLSKASELNAIPFDIPGVEYTHYDQECTFDYFIKKHKITDRGVLAMAPVIRGADTDQHHFSKQSAGLWAISAGLAYNAKDDYQLLEQGYILYDALYGWATHLQKVKHIEQPFEQLLLAAVNSFSKSKSSKSKTPSWAIELKQLIQDHLDTAITLKEISKDLDMSPSHLSREFSRYFEDQSFGEYTRKRRIEKAIELMKDPKHSLTDIAYLTGFSDQSHFNRIFRQQIGQTPFLFRKNLSKK